MEYQNQERCTKRRRLDQESPYNTLENRTNINQPILLIQTFSSNSQEDQDNLRRTPSPKENNHAYKKIK